MPAIELILDGDQAWPDLVARGTVVAYLDDVAWRLAAFEGGMSSGAPSLALRLDLPPEVRGTSVVVAKTSLAAWIAATCALRGRFPEAFAGTPLEARPA